MAVRIDQPALTPELVDEACARANELTGLLQPPIEQPIELYDNTLREGEQPPGVAFSPDQKLELARALDAAGVHWANVGFPVVSRQERESIERICAAGLKMKVAALSRPTDADIDLTAETGVDMISLFLGTSDVHLRDKLRISEAEAIETVRRGVARVKERGQIAGFTAEDGSRTPLRRLLKVFEAAEAAGADYLSVADTVGIMTPTAMYRLVSLLRATFPTPIGLHLHDDLGLALANSLAGLEAGATQIHVTVNGVGERCGNACLEELVVVLRLKYRRDIGVRLDRLAAISELVHRMSRTEAPPHKSITGKWSFTHESGIHVAGILANPETYQPFPPALIGRHHEIVFGKHSGAQSVRFLAERCGVTLAKDAVAALVDRIKAKAEATQSSVPDELVMEWIRSTANGGGSLP